MSRHDHPSYGRHTRSHHHIAGAQQSRGRHSVDAATHGRAVRSNPPERAALHRDIAWRMTVAFLGLVALVGIAQRCDTPPEASVLCAEAFCAP